MNLRLSQQPLSEQEVGWDQPEMPIKSRKPPKRSQGLYNKNILLLDLMQNWRMWVSDTRAAKETRGKKLSCEVQPRSFHPDTFPSGRASCATWPNHFSTFLSAALLLILTIIPEGFTIPPGSNDTLRAWGKSWGTIKRWISTLLGLMAMRANWQSFFWLREMCCCPSSSWSHLVVGKDLVSIMHPNTSQNWNASSSTHLPETPAPFFPFPPCWLTFTE